MFSYSWSQALAAVALQGLAIHVLYRLYRLRFEIPYVARTSLENLLFGFIALALWVLAVAGVVFLAGNELFGWEMPKVFGVFARSQCVFFAVVWGAKAFSRYSFTPSCPPLEALRRFVTAFVAAAWVCGLVLCVKWYGWAVVDGSRIPCPVFVLQLLIGASIGLKFVRESLPDGALRGFVTLREKPKRYR